MSYVPLVSWKWPLSTKCVLYSNKESPYSDISSCCCIHMMMLIKMQMLLVLMSKLTLMLLMMTMLMWMKMKMLEVRCDQMKIWFPVRLFATDPLKEYFLSSKNSFSIPSDLIGWKPVVIINHKFNSASININSYHDKLSLEPFWTN